MKLSEFLESYKYSVLWKRFKGGSYNHLAVSQAPVKIEEHNNFWVRKEPIVCLGERFPVNSVERAVRKFFELNPGSMAFNDGARAWFLPFFGVSPFQPVEYASDLETAAAVFEIYQRTGNIVADAAIVGNFLFDKGNTVCVDVDLATRRGSISSDNYYNETIASAEFDKFFSNDLKKVKAELQRPITAHYIKILFYLDECLAQFSGEHQMLHIDMLPYIFNFCIQQIQITENIYHNLQVLVSDIRYLQIPMQWLEPSLFCQISKVLNFEELFLQLQTNYEVHQASKLQPSSEEQDVANVLDQIVDTIDKQMTFEYSFFANLPKRPLEYAAKSEASINADLKSVR